MKYLTIEGLPDLPFDVAESLNQLRINLGFSGENIRTIMVTSSMPNEGKSFITMNLWKMMASVGNRVLLVDCDLRNSVLVSDYNMRSEENMVGIVHYLAAKNGLNDVIYETNIPNGYIIPVTTNVTDPTILLESKRFQHMVDECKREFDYILLDTPPLGSVADSLTVAGYADGSLLVIRSGDEPRKLVAISVQLLRRTEVPLLGVVLNRVSTTRKGYNYYYRYNFSRYGYGYGYAYGYGRPKKKKS